MNGRDLEERYALPVYPRRGVTIVRGEGALLWDDQGSEYLDCAAGVGVASIGHANPAVAAALAHQAESLITCPGIFFNDTRGQLMKKLVEVTPTVLYRVFLCNSGKQIIESELKFAIKTTGSN